MKVILTEDLYKHGVAGEVVSVSDGFARNWLIPKKMAIPATKKNLEQQTDLRAKAELNRDVYNGKINAAARQINGVELVFGVKAGNNNKLYGSITSQMIKDAILEKTGLDINRRRISERPIRELGRYDIPVRMGEVSPVVHLIVIREEEVGSYLASLSQAGAQAAEGTQPVEAASAEGAETAQAAPAQPEAAASTQNTSDAAQQ